MVFVKQFYTVDKSDIWLLVTASLAIHPMSSVLWQKVKLRKSREECREIIN